MYINTLIQQLIADPRGVLLFFLLALPGRLLAISAHEAAHGWVAARCGDPTARLMGRVSLNPLKHFDLVGTICLLLFGFGWAKPVPVNPNNFRNYRSDDLKVSLAGITMNLLLFLTGAMALSLMDRVPFVQAAFEVASGMGTVGVTMGITPSLTVGSALLMVALMFLGRVGILSFSIAFLTRKQAEHKISYPATDVMIG